MTRGEIIDMAKPFLWGGNVVEGWTFHSYEQLECFAKLVAEHERESCAKVAYDYTVKVSLPNFYESAEYVANAIRARGQE
jgi:hypothetical protein